MKSVPSTSAHTAPCCIVGGGPAGMMLGYLLARANVSVVVLEAHADFLRDFRGDTVHPSTLEVLDEVGLLDTFGRLPQRRVDHLAVQIGGRTQPFVDFRGLRPFDFLAFVPQWDFLTLLAEEGRRFASFDLRMQHRAVGLIRESGRVVGVTVRTPRGDQDIRAALVVGCDGRRSTLREAAGLRATEYGAPMDVLWFRLPRYDCDSEETFGIIGAGHILVLLNRTDYWQAAYVVPKGSDGVMRARPIDELRRAVAHLAPFLADRMETVESWDQVRTLEVRVDRLDVWYQPGLLLIGDAAHAMSPIGGVGINLAIQDAVAAANVLVPALRAGDRIEDAQLRRVQRRRLLPTQVIQSLQLQIQKRVIAKAIAPSTTSVEFPTILRRLLQYRAIRRIPARLIGYGIRREHVET